MKIISKTIWVTSLKSLSTYATYLLIELCQIVVTLSETHFILPWSRSRTRPLPHASLLHWKLATYPLIHPPNKNSMSPYGISLIKLDKGYGAMQKEIKDACTKMVCHMLRHVENKICIPKESMPHAHKACQKKGRGKEMRKR